MDRIFWKCFVQVLGHGIRAICVALLYNRTGREDQESQMYGHLHNMQRCIDVALKEG